MSNYTQQELLSSMDDIKRAREELAAKQRGTSPVENKVDMTPYASVSPEVPVEKDVRLLFGALQRKVLDLEVRLTKLEESVAGMGTTFYDALDQLSKFIGELEDKYPTVDTVGPERYEVE